MLHTVNHGGNKILYGDDGVKSVYRGCKRNSGLCGFLFQISACSETIPFFRLKASFLQIKTTKNNIRTHLFPGNKLLNMYPVRRIGHE